MCVFGTTATSPYRVGFKDASGNIVTMGDAWRLRQCSGACLGALNGDMWFDTSTGLAMVKQGGSNLPIGVTTSGGALVLAANVRSSAMRWSANNGLTFAANNYWGPGSEASATATNVAPMIAHCSGSVTSLHAQANANATGTTVVTLHRSAGGATLTYAATLLTCTIGSGAKFCSDTVHSYAAVAGDVFVIRITSSNWSPAGATASVRLACDST